MADKDFYEILGVAKNAGEDEIKKSYRKLAMQYHPDRNKDDKAAERKFKEASAAYEILKDPQKRAAYDQYGHDAFRQGGLGGAHGFGDFGGVSRKYGLSCGVLCVGGCSQCHGALIMLR